MITINALVEGESIVLLTTPALATDTVDTAQVLFDFDSEWDGCEKTAMFWGADDDEYQSPVVDNAAIIPREAMLEAGKMKMGVYGTDEGKRIVSAKIPYKISEGAFVRN